MRILCDPRQIASLDDRPLQALLAQRFDEVSDGEAFDPSRMARFVIVEPGDPLPEIEARSGALLTQAVLDDVAYPEPSSSPSFEVLQCHDLDGLVYEYVEIISEGEFAIALFIRERPGVDELVMCFCRECAQPVADSV
ncbi:MAG: hypothetical protein JNJ60_19945 [Rhodocyclaceae bacterium]|nr:hypothetical protein [Rhodocyclaceae bacterium]